MWFLLAVLFLLGSTEVIGEFPDHVLPPMARWGWWTSLLLSCGMASIYTSYDRFHWKALGLVCCTMFYTSYPLLWDEYLAMMPTEPATFPWSTVFVVFNVVLPVVLVTIGPLIPVVRRGS